MSEHTPQQDKIPYGYCHCGCGQKTTISKSSSPKRGDVKGEPRSFVSGHNSRVQATHTHPPVEQRFWEKVDRRGPNDCWEWQAYCDEDGYGKITVNRFPRRAHRFSWQLAHGPIPNGAWVLHKCDNRPCVNPGHLYLGTAADNARDALQRTGHYVGENAPTAKLTWDQVRQIRKRYAAGETRSSIASDYGVTRGCIGHIVINQTWVENGERHKPNPDYRPPKGVHNPACKITIEDAREIRRRYKGGESAYQIANDYPLGRSSIYNIIHGVTYPESPSDNH